MYNGCLAKRIKQVSNVAQILPDWIGHILKAKKCARTYTNKG